MRRHYDITINGKVQGVFFRASAKQMADLIDVKGSVQNENNGNVFIEAEGEEDLLVKFIQWCHHGPSNAEVKHVSVREGVVLGYKEFKVKRNN